MAAPLTSAGSRNTPIIVTLQRYLKEMADNLTSGPGLLRYAKRKGLIRMENLTGYEERVIIDREDNRNEQWFDDADQFSLTPTNGLIDSYVGHYNIRTGFYFSDTEELENAGDGKWLDLMEVKLNACKRQFKVQISTAMVGTAGSNTKIAPGIRDLMGGGNPASSPSTYQGLAPATYSYWSPDVNVVSGGLGPNNSQMRAEAIHQFANLKLKMGDPKVGICDQLFYEEWCKTYGGGAETAGYGIANQRTYSADAPMGRLDSGGSGGVADISWRGKEIIFDEYVAVPSTYTAGTDPHVNWIDTDFYYFKVDPRWNFKLFKPRERAGDDAQWVSHYAIVFRYTPICTSRRAHGITVFNL